MAPLKVLKQHGRFFFFFLYAEDILVEHEMVNQNFSFDFLIFTARCVKHPGTFFCSNPATFQALRV